MLTDLIFGALSIAVLSFLGFDAISTLAEETRGGTRLVGQATMMALCLAAVLFIAQPSIGVLLVPVWTAFVDEDATNDAFYAVSALVGGPALKLVAAVSLILGLFFVRQVALR